MPLAAGGCSGQHEGDGGGKHEGGGTQDVTRQVGNLCSDPGDGHSLAPCPPDEDQKLPSYMAVSVPQNSLP